MAKFCGKVGYFQTVETDPGVWEETIIEKEYRGDLVRNMSKFQSSGGINDNIAMANSIIIIADPYANQNFQHMRYVLFMGTKWKISDIEVQYPRIILTVGGVYNEK